LQRIIASYEPGERVQITVIRYGEELTFNLRLAEAELPQPEPARAAAGGEPSNILIGIQVSDLDPELAQRAGLDPQS
ncbi:MAG: hypothetical protein GWN32_16915, partial [Gemmatimonadetes bacterium]|nr:hypothetical protein [Gemmatimonadota bacterium]